MAETLELPVAMIEELQSNENVQNLLNVIKIIFETSFNIRLVDRFIPFDEMKGKGTAIKEIQNVTGVLFPAELLDIASNNIWYYTAYFSVTEIALLTPPPQLIETYSTSFLELDTMVTILSVTCVLALPLLTIFVIQKESIWFRLKKYPEKFKSNGSFYLNLIWEYVCVFFFEPFTYVPKSIPGRMLIASWLIFISILTIYMGSYLNSEVYSTDFIFVNNLEDLYHKTKLDLRYMEYSSSDNYVKYWEEDNRKKQSPFSFKHRSSFVSISDLLDIDFYRDIHRGKFAYVIPRFFLEQIMGLILEGEPLDELLIHYNSEIMKTITFVFPLDIKVKECHPLSEQINLAMMAHVETQATEYLYFNNRFLVRQTQWEKPANILTALSMKQSSGAFLILIYCHGIAISIAIIEIFIGFIKTYFHIHG